MDAILCPPGVRPEDIGPQYGPCPGPFVTGWHYTIDLYRAEVYHDSCFPGGDRTAIAGEVFGLVGSCMWGGFYGYSLSGQCYPPDAFVAVGGLGQTGGGLIGYRRT